MDCLLRIATSSYCARRQWTVFLHFISIYADHIVSSVMREEHELSPTQQMISNLFVMIDRAELKVLDMVLLLRLRACQGTSMYSLSAGNDGQRRSSHLFIAVLAAQFHPTPFRS